MSCEDVVTQPSRKSNVLSSVTVTLYVAVYFVISVNCYFSFVSNPLAYFTITKNNGKMKITAIKNELQHIYILLKVKVLF